MKNFVLKFVVITILVCFLCTFGCLEQKSESKEIAPQQTASYPDPLDELIKVENAPQVKQETPVQQEQTPVSAEVKATEPNDSTVLVTVNGQNITEGQVKEILQPLLEGRTAMGQPSSESLTEQYKSRVLDDIITNIVFEQQLKANSIVVTGEDVNSVVTKILSLSEPPMTIGELKNTIESRGSTLEQWKMMMGFEQKLQIEKLLNIKDPNILRVTEEEARNFYDGNPSYFDKKEQVKASHIFIRPDRTDPNNLEAAKLAARARAEGLLRQAREGADFAVLAKDNSDDVVSARAGGDLGYFDKARMVPEFAEAAFSLQVGQISDIVETPYGYHIILLTGHKDPYVIPYEDTRDKIIYSLGEQKLKDAAPEYIKDLKENAKIVYPEGSTLRAYQPVRSTIRTDNIQKVN